MRLNKFQRAIEPGVHYGNMLSALTSGTASRIQFSHQFESLKREGLLTENNVITVYNTREHGKRYDDDHAFTIPSEHAKDALKFMAKSFSQSTKKRNILHGVASAYGVTPGFVASVVKAARDGKFDEEYETSQKGMVNRLVRLGILGNDHLPVEMHGKAVAAFLKAVKAELSDG